MADNVAISAGSGTLIATDDIGGVHVQRVKLTAGADGTATDLPGDATNGLGVDVTRLPSAATDSGTLGALDDAVTVAMRGQSGASAWIGEAPTADLFITPEASYDNGATWVPAFLWDDSSFRQVSTNSFGTAKGWDIIVLAGATHVRLRVSAWTSGSVDVALGAGRARSTQVVEGLVTVTGIVDVFGPVPVTDNDGSLTVDDGGASLTIDDGGSSLTVDSAQLPAALVSGRLDIHIGSGEVELQAGQTIGIQDNGGSITVDGAVSIASALPTGTNNIGDVGVLTLPALPAGANTIGGVTDGGGSLTVDSPQLPAALVSGRLDVSVGAALPAGTNNIGDVDVLSLPALPAGTNNIGDVDVLTLPSIPTGSNTIGSVTQTLGGSLVSATNPLPVYETSPPGITYTGRVNTFRTPGRAGTAGQKIFALHNATGSTKVVQVKLLAVDMTCTVIKAVTVLPPMIRCCRFTAVPTNGTSLTKVPRDTALTPTASASITAWGDASADGTLSASALTIAAITVGAAANAAAVTQEFAPRLITAVGYEMYDRTEFLRESPVTLRALEGIVVFLDYVLATQNPATDMWMVTCEWDES